MHATAVNSPRDISCSIKIDFWNNNQCQISEQLSQSIMGLTFIVSCECFSEAFRLTFFTLLSVCFLWFFPLRKISWIKYTHRHVNRCEKLPISFLYRSTTERGCESFRGISLFGLKTRLLYFSELLVIELKQHNYGILWIHESFRETIRR